MTLKGIGYKSDTAENIRRINSLNPKWWYNWNQYRQAATKDSIPVEFVPMLFSDSNSGTRPRLDNFAADIAALKAESPRTVTAILGFNEPDHPQQSNMTPLEALNGWKYIQDNGYALRKGSPAAVGTTTIWMNQFMDAQKGLDQTKQSWERDFEVNFVACHIYQGPIASDWLKKVDALYARFGKPVWVTETCVHDNAATTLAENQYTREQINQYIKDIWAGAQTRPWLERIAWHTREVTDPQGGTGALFNTDGSLTSTGVVWRDLDKV